MNRQFNTINLGDYMYNDNKLDELNIEISRFKENLKEYPSEILSNSSNRKLVLGKKGFHRYLQCNTSHNMKQPSKENTDALIEKCDSLHTDLNELAKVFERSKTYGELCVNIHENDLFPSIQRFTSEVLPLILNHIHLAERRNLFEILHTLKEWNDKFAIQQNYQAMRSLLTNLNKKQVEKGWEKLKLKTERTKQRSCKQSERYGLQIVRLKDTKRDDLDNVYPTTIDLNDKKVLKSLMYLPGHVTQTLAHERVYPIRNPLVDNPSSRLYTFTAWPLRTQFWPQQLANAGFYYTREGTTVKCASCGVVSSVENWSRQDRPESVHYNLNNECEFIRGNFPHLANQTESSSVDYVLTHRPVNERPESDGAVLTSNNAVNSGITTNNDMDNTNRNKSESNGRTTDQEIASTISACTEPSITPSLYTHERYSNHSEYIICPHGNRDSSQIQQETIQNGTSQNHTSHQPQIHVYGQADVNPNRTFLDTARLQNKRELGVISHETQRQQDRQEVSASRSTVDNHSDYNLIASAYPNINPHNSAYSRNGINQSMDVDQLPSNISTQSTHDRVISEPDFSFPEYRELCDRIDTFSNWPASSTQSSTLLAETGCFYTGESDVVRCFCCNLGLAEWATTDDPWVEHARHSPKCWFLRKQKGQSFIDDVQDEWKKRYKPKNPAFDDHMSRLATFEDWRDDIEQTPELLADAGFFSTGEDDIVRCHYCDGGLRNWERGDMPWEEHARWFPHCKFLIKMKGCQYINSIKEKYRNANPSGNQEQETSRLLSSEAARTLINMEVPVSDIKLAINNFIKEKGHSNFKVDDLLDMIYSSKSATSHSPTAALPAENRPLPAERDPTHLKVINARLKESLLCVICKKNNRCMLFVNCGHRLTCEQCCRSIDYCPHCDKRIKKVIKTYLS